jgi:hypothetical protein
MRSSESPSSHNMPTYAPTVCICYLSVISSKPERKLCVKCAPETYVDDIFHSKIGRGKTRHRKAMRAAAGISSIIHHEAWAVLHEGHACIPRNESCHSPTCTQAFLARCQYITTESPASTALRNKCQRPQNAPSERPQNAPSFLPPNVILFGAIVVPREFPKYQSACLPAHSGAEVLQSSHTFTAAKGQFLRDYPDDRAGNAIPMHRMMHEPGCLLPFAKPENHNFAALEPVQCHDNKTCSAFVESPHFASSLSQFCTPCATHSGLSLNPESHGELSKENAEHRSS